MALGKDTTSSHATQANENALPAAEYALTIAKIPTLSLQNRRDKGGEPSMIQFCLNGGIGIGMDLPLLQHPPAHLPQRSNTWAIKSQHNNDVSARSHRDFQG